MLLEWKQMSQDFCGELRMAGNVRDSRKNLPVFDFCDVPSATSESIIHFFRCKNFDSVARA